MQSGILSHVLISFSIETEWGGLISDLTYEYRIALDISARASDSAFLK